MMLDWLDPTSGIIMLAGIFYGAMYGGSTTAKQRDVNKTVALTTSHGGSECRVEVGIVDLGDR